MRNADAHQSKITINHALTSVIGCHPSPLWISLHQGFSCGRTILLLTDVPIQDHTQQFKIY